MFLLSTNYQGNYIASKLHTRAHIKTYALSQDSITKTLLT